MTAQDDRFLIAQIVQIGDRRRTLNNPPIEL